MARSEDVTVDGRPTCQTSHSGHSRGDTHEAHSRSALTKRTHEGHSRRTLTKGTHEARMLDGQIMGKFIDAPRHGQSGTGVTRQNGQIILDSRHSSEDMRSPDE